jgi:hypothetical protein
MALWPALSRRFAIASGRRTPAGEVLRVGGFSALDGTPVPDTIHNDLFGSAIDDILWLRYGVMSETVTFVPFAPHQWALLDTSTSVLYTAVGTRALRRFERGAPAPARAQTVIGPVHVPPLAGVSLIVQAVSGAGDGLDIAVRIASGTTGSAHSTWVATGIDGPGIIPLSIGASAGTRLSPAEIVVDLELQTSGAEFDLAGLLLTASTTALPEPS